MTIDLPLWDKQLRQWRTVTAELLPALAPHLSGTFAIHKCPWSEDVGDTFWKVSNVETGCYVSAPAFTDCARRKDVIEGVRTKLAKATEEMLQEKYRAARRQQRGE